METTVYPARAVRLRPGACVAAGQDGRTVVSVGDASMQLPPLPPGSYAVLESLATGDVPEAQVQQRVIAADDMPGLLRWQAVLTRLDAAGVLERSVLTGAGPVARLRRAVIGRSPASTARAPAVARLSRFTVVRAAGGKLIAERPGGQAYLELEPAVAG